MAHNASAPTLPDLLTLAAALEQDQRQPDAERRRTDQALAVTLQGLARRPAWQLVAWADAVAERDPQVATAAHRAAVSVWWVSTLAALLGVLLGVGASAGVFYYDGSGRINVLAVLAVFVVLPVLLLVPMAIAMVPSRLSRAVPGVGPLSELLRGISMGRVAAFGVRLLPRQMRDSLAWASDTLATHRRIYAHVEKWAVLAWSQSFAVMFTASAIVTLLLLVVFTDLAFGWSTTLDVDAGDIHAMTDALATPWAATGRATPSLALIEQSRYYRLDDAPPAAVDPSALGAWWLFLVAAMACYGLVPRLATLGLCLYARRRAVRAALLTTPGASAVLRRLHHAALRQAGDPDTSTAATDGSAEMRMSESLPMVGAVIVWAGAPVDDAALAASLGTAADRFEAGGSSTVAADRAVIERLASADDKPVVALVVKAWEPPMGELLDFLRDLRAALGDGVEITVLPVGEATPAQAQAWPRRLASLRDPWLRVVAPKRVEEAEHA